MMMIETRGLCKSFGDHVVLDGIDLDVAEGSIFALLGPNGAGKTTTFRSCLRSLELIVARCGLLVTTRSGSLLRSALRSVSPASSQRWTTC